MRHLRKIFQKRLALPVAVLLAASGAALGIASWALETSGSGVRLSASRFEPAPAFANNVLYLLNGQRRAQGRGELVALPYLTAVAALRALDSARRGTPETALAEDLAGLRLDPRASAGFTSASSTCYPSEALAQLLEGGDFRRVLLDERVRSVGVGVAVEVAGDDLAATTNMLEHPAPACPHSVVVVYFTTQ